MLNNIGNIYDDMGKYEQAMQNYEQSLSIRGEIKGKESEEYADTLHNIGIVLDEKGEYESALQKYEQSL